MGKERITRVSPAGPDHQVVQVTGPMIGYRKTPCATCPWRVDQVGEFPAEAFRISADTAYDAAFETFACHRGGIKRALICAGFLLQNSMNNIGARLKGISGGPGCRSRFKLFDSYRAMAVANGVAPDDPMLAKCRADDE
jgi:hypothetical protein